MREESHTKKQGKLYVWRLWSLLELTKSWGLVVIRDNFVFRSLSMRKNSITLYSYLRRLCLEKLAQRLRFTPNATMIELMQTPTGKVVSWSVVFMDGTRFGIEFTLASTIFVQL